MVLGLFGSKSTTFGSILDLCFRLEFLVLSWTQHLWTQTFTIPGLDLKRNQTERLET